MSLFLLLIFGACAWVRPVLGFGIYMLLLTPVGHVVEPYIHVYAWAFLLMPAIIRLLLRRGRPLRSVEVCGLVFSAVLLIREFVTLPPEFSGTKYVYIPLIALTWGPLLRAFNALDEREISGLRIWMIVVASIIGLWGALIYLTDNSYLISMAKANALFTVGNNAATIEKLVENRFMVTGLYGIIPYAYWYVLRDALTHTKQRLIWNFVTWAGVGAILVTVGLSLTRSLMILLLIGSTVMIGLQMFNKNVGRRRTMPKYVPVVLGLCFLFVAVYYVDFSSIWEPFTNRFATLTSGDEGVRARLTNNSIAWTYIKEHGCFFGASNAGDIVGVDTAVSLRVWLMYGLVGCIFFSAMFIGSIGILFKCMYGIRSRPEDIAIRNMLAAWALVYVYVHIVGYTIEHTESVFFTMLFFSEISRLNNKRLMPNTFQSGRLIQ